ncbi:tRNA glutamyl-Q(34) synthetase GluQRS [Caulobacter segnis]|uniref:Glutamyl/glutaminyl-tRNA synthetase, class Ic, catalytic domain protein n=2 Tax=Caulobacter segnis TaxID=88688 RepID=D5VLD1_CAUST|nr:tRNA glutamyl-Q(34) synthetase GluQRS [Caulobacter segnis]ADG11304.1 Glutamyl/glutaminyl-tRNA synthetase, class Ic, catalytic domain protein [Caulobacter segnis ATCC 21756]AVQ02974.1 tRNA glutamyl-Q(34) synthetase GluQRS [Caulobacter segnis]
MTFVTRFAPSPTGHLHRGHAYSALTAYEAARVDDGRFLLRIEDIDVTRSRPEYETAILEDLAWLGLSWESPVRRQSEHLADYHAAIESLRARGLVYRCFKTRKEIDIGRAPHEPAVAYVGAALPPEEEAQRLARGEAFAWRLSLAAARAALGGFEGLTFIEEGSGPNGETGLIQARPETAGDIVLARKDVGVAYHLAVVHDDALQGVSHVIRGHDLFEAAHIQRLLQTLLDLPAPIYRHHGLLVGPDGKRYAKRDKAQTLRELRAGGVSPAALRKELGFG